MGTLRGMRTVFTCGVFDVLHAGHVAYLQASRALGDRLIVAVNSDASTRRLKGSARPVNSLQDRMAVLSALRCVDQVVSFEEDTPLNVICDFEPEIFTKGGDYRAEDLPETPLVRGWGGEVVILPFLEGRSTTTVLAALDAVE